MFLFAIQAGLPKQPDYLNLNSEIVSNQSYFFIALNLAVLAVLVLALVFLVRALLRSSSFLPASFSKVVMLVTVPKESADAAEQEETIEQLKNQISVAESLFASLGGQPIQKGFRAWLWGRTDHFSLEIVAKYQKISFYVAVPKYLQGYMEQQILAQYPEANLTEVEDYNIFSPQSEILSGYLKFSRSFIFPIKSYLNLNSDPLNSLTNSLSAVESGDGVALQIIARSSHRRWHYQGSKVATELQKGKSLAEAIEATKTFSIAKTFNFFGSKKPEQLEQEKLDKSGGLSPMQQELVKGLEEKTSKAGLDCNIRIIVSAKTKAAADIYLKNVVNSFAQFNYYEYGNSFKLTKDSSSRLIRDFIYRHYRENQKLILNIEELASLYHFPTPFLDTPNIEWLLAKKLPPATGLSTDGLLLGENIYRGKKANIYLAPEDRRRHMYIIGMTGTGKSVLMSNLAIQDIRDGKGVCVIDPHGSLVESILENIPKERIDEVVYFNPADTDRPIGLNMLEADGIQQQDFAIQEMISIFYKLVTDPSMIGPMFEHNMRNAMLTLMADKEFPGTIAEIPRIFTDRNFQRYKLKHVTDPMVRSFWEQEMANNHIRRNGHETQS